MHHLLRFSQHWQTVLQYIRGLAAPKKYRTEAPAIIDTQAGKKLIKSEQGGAIDRHTAATYEF